MDILRAIGNTSLVRLRKVVPANGAAIDAKLEWENGMAELWFDDADALLHSREPRVACRKSGRAELPESPEHRIRRHRGASWFPAL